MNPRQAGGLYGVARKACRRFHFAGLSSDWTASTIFRWRSWGAVTMRAFVRLSATASGEVTRVDERAGQAVVQFDDLPTATGARIDRFVLLRLTGGR